MRMQWITLAIGLGCLGAAAPAGAEGGLPAHALPAQPTRQVDLSPSESASSSPIRQLASSYKTPQAIAAFLRNEFTFTRDEDLFGETDHWQTPQEFAMRRVGDCEDYALLAQALLRAQGIQADVFSLLGEDGYAHTVSVFVDTDGRYAVINQGRLQRYRAQSLEEVATALNPFWTVGMIAEQDGARGRIVRAIYHDQPAGLMHDAGVPF